MPADALWPSSTANLIINRVAAVQAVHPADSALKRRGFVDFVYLR